MPDRRWLIASFALAATCALAAGDDSAGSALGGDQFIAGGSVSRTEPVAGDLIAAGGEVELAAPVQGDAVAAGGNLRIGGNVAQNVYGAGGRVRLDGQVGRNARIAGGRVEVGPSATVAGNLTVAGGRITVRGAVKGYVQASGGEVTIDGPVDGDVVVHAGKVELGPNAKIGGAMRYGARDDLVRDPSAQVSGEIERLSGPGARQAGGHGVAAATRFAAGWMWSAGLIVLAALLAAAVPPASMRVSSELRLHPGLSLLFGFIALVCIPVGAIVLLVTIVGIPLAFVVLLAYFALLILGYVATGIALGEAALARLRPAEAMRSAWRVPAAMAAMLALTLVARIPFVGGFVLLVATLAGLGAILMAMRPRKPPDHGFAPAAAD